MSRKYERPKLRGMPNSSDATPDTGSGVMAPNQATHCCLFLPSLNGGGAERVMVSLANGLVARGYRVSVVLAEHEGGLRDELVPAAVVKSLGCRNVALALPRFARFLRTHKPDVVISALSASNLVALAAARLPGCEVPVIATEHSSLDSVLKDRPRGRRLLLKWLVRELYPRAAELVAVSPGAAGELAHLTSISGSRVRVITNPIDICEVRARAGGNTPSHETDPLILAVGRLVSVKRFGDLIKAFRNVIAVIPARLEILGEGPEREALGTLCAQLGISERVSMPGFAANPYEKMSKASVLVCSSAIEGFCNVLVEAMALGTPVVSTDCPHGPRFILEDGRWGSLVPVGDIRALATAIIDALRNPPADSEALMARAQTFDAVVSIDAYASLIEGVLKGSMQSR